MLLGNGDGTFQTPQTGVGYASGGLGGESLAVADVSGDGKPDVIVGNQCTAFNNSSSCAEPLVGVIGVLLGNGDGTFQTAAPYSLGGYVADSVDVADMNGDGIPDIVAASACNLDCSAGWVNVLLGIGDGTFQTQGPQSITVNSTSGTAPSTSTSITVLKKTATSIRVTSVNPASEAYSQDAPVAITAVLFWTGTGPAPTASDVAIGGNGSGTYGTTTCGAPAAHRSLARTLTRRRLQMRPAHARKLQPSPATATTPAQAARRAITSPSLTPLQPRRLHRMRTLQPLANL